MKRFSERDWKKLTAIQDNVQRMGGQSDLAVMLRRINDWSWGLTAATFDDPVSTSDHSDPTAMSAISQRARMDRATPDLAEVAFQVLYWTEQLERAMPALTKSTQPTPEQVKAADQATGAPVAEFRPGEGTCEACGRECIGGKERKERIHTVEGHPLCYSHYSGYHTRGRGRTVEDYVRSIQLTRTSTLAQPTELHDPDAA